MNVAKECRGLPLALVTVAAALRNSSVHSWEDALHQLKRSMATDIEDVFEEVYVPLKWSYDQLRNEEARYLFRLCGLFPEDYEIPVERLVRYVFGLHIFTGVESLTEARNRVYRLTEILKDRSLLIGSPVFSVEDWAERDCVKMHDIIRDMAISISSQEKHSFMVIHDKNLKEWPNKYSYDNITCISLGSESKISLPENINCSTLELLYLSFVRGGVEVPESSLHGMRRLKVLITYGVQSLPVSLPLLTNLQSLFLEWSRFQKLPDEIGKLVNLEILSLANSSIGTLQKEIGRLKNLKLLDLTGCEKLENIAPGVISELVQLEELFMLGGFNNWEAEEMGRNNASVAEVASLTKLVALRIEVPKQDRINFTKDTRNWHKLTRFHVEIGSFRYIPESSERKINLVLDKVVHLTDPVRVILDNAEVIGLWGEGSSEITNHLPRSGFQNAKILDLRGCGNLEVLFDSSSWNLPNTAFLPRATKLSIRLMGNVRKEVCRGHPPAGSFSNLKNISLWQCDGLKNLFSFSIAAMLSNLENIWIRDSYSMETVFLEQNGRCENEAISKIAFPKLFTITLFNLPSLRAFCNATDTIAVEFPELKELALCRLPEIQQFSALPSYIGIRSFFDGVTFNKLRILQLSHVNAPTLFGYRFSVANFNELEELLVEFCDTLEELISKKDKEDESNSTEILFPKLKILELIMLPKLNTFWHIKHDVILPSLERVSIRGCDRLKSVSPPLSRGLLNLQVLEVGGCPMLKKLIPEEEKEDEANGRETLFPRLVKLDLWFLPKLIRFCHIKHDVKLPSLERASIDSCPSLGTFSLGEVHVPSSAIFENWASQYFIKEQDI